MRRLTRVPVLKAGIAYSLFGYGWCFAAISPICTELIAEFENTISHIDAVRFDADVTMRSFRTGSSRNDVIARHKESYVKIGTEWHLYSHITYTPADDGVSLPVEESERLVGKDRVLSIRRRGYLSKADANGILPTDSGPRDQGDVAVVASLLDSNADNPQSDAPSFGDAFVPQFLFCRFPIDGKQSLSAVLSDSQDCSVETRSEIDGYNCSVLTTKGRYGKHEVWLDPASNYLPRKVVITKSGTDLFGRSLRPLNEDRKLDPLYRRGTNAGRKQATFEMLDIRIEEVKGTPLVTAFHTDSETVFMNGAIAREEITVELTNISWQPDPKELSMRMTIPDGTGVFIDNAPAIECEWRDGQIVKLFDNSVVSQLSDLSFRSKASLGRRWLIGANVAVIALILAILVQRRLAGGNR